MYSRLKAAPTSTLAEREMLRFSWVKTKLQEVTVVIGVNGRITDKQKVLLINPRKSETP